MSHKNSVVPRRWTGPMVWDGNSVGKQYDWLFRLGKDDLAEIRTAVKGALLQGKSLGDLTWRDFDLKHLGPRLLRARDDVLEGAGFSVIRGLPVGRWSREELIYAYWAIGAWFGDPVPQNARADLLGHVIDRRSSSPTAAIRIYQTNQAQPFHSDSCDIVGLLCLRQAKQGGASSIASAPAIHNALMDNDPLALETLYREFLCDRYDEIPEGKKPYYPVRVFNEVDGNFVCCGMDPDIRSAQRLDHVAPLSKDQIHALDAFQETAKSLSLYMILEPGDIQLVNNLTIVHAREPFEDFPEPDKRRYLIRLWLSSPLGRTLPAFLIERWGNIETGAVRGGIRIPGATPGVYLEHSL